MWPGRISPGADAGRLGFVRRVIPKSPSSCATHYTCCKWCPNPATARAKCIPTHSQVLIRSVFGFVAGRSAQWIRFQTSRARTASRTVRSVARKDTVGHAKHNAEAVKGAQHKACGCSPRSAEFHLAMPMPLGQVARRSAQHVRSRCCHHMFLRGRGYAAARTWCVAGRLRSMTLADPITQYIKTCYVLT